MENELKESPLELLWEKEIEKGISNVVFAEGNIVVGTKDGWIKCFDLGGELRWEYKKEGIYPGQITKEYVTATSKDGLAYLIDTNGNLKLNLNIGGHVWCPKISNNNIITSSTNEQLSLFDMDGIKKWNKNIPFLTGANIFGDNVVAYTHKGGVFSFDIKGNLKWQFTADNEIHRTYLLEDKIIICDHDAGFYILDMDGNLKVKYLTHSCNCAWNVSQDYIVVTTVDDVLLFDMKKYTLIWRKNIFEIMDEDDTSGMYPCIFKDIILVGTGGGYIYIFDIYGNIKERYAVGNWASLVYPYLQNEHLYFIIREEDTNIIYFYKFIKKPSANFS